MKINMKFLKTTTALCLGLGLGMAAQAAPILTVGDVAFKFNSVSFFSAPDNGVFGGISGNGMSDLPGFGGVTDTQPVHPATPAGTDGRTWGIADVTSIAKLVSGNIENPGALGTPIWSETAGDHLQIRFGGMTMSHINPAAPVGFPYDIYFGLDAAAANPGGTAYMEFYTSAVNNFALDAVASAGTGAYGTFGANIATGTKWLDITLKAGILSQVDPFALATDIEKATIGGLLTGGTTMYGDVTTAGSPLNTNLLPLFPILPTGVTADVKIQSTLSSMFNPTTAPGTWTDPNWTSLANDPMTGRVPEPATLLLLGAGLLGLVGARRNKAA